mmetsp:Transcript_100132/g.254686  ORF Transcript_100132/g.254686 Transcript_100132/m.254686 type:complete len:429 (-) Transcript_100132:104-1390(-)
MPAFSRSGAVVVRKEDGHRMEQEAQMMQAKLEMLKKTLDETTAPKGDSGSRWKAGSVSKPLTRGYVKGVLDVSKVAGAKPRLPGARSTGGSQGGSGEATPTTKGALAELLAAPLEGGFGGFSAPLSGAGAGAGTGAAGRNLQAAMQHQSQDTREVETFLSNLKLDRYVGIFMENGLDSMDVVMDMQESHMREIGMAVGHILKLQKSLNELRPAPAATSERRVNFGVTEVADSNTAVAKPPAAPATATAASCSLTDGAFDEAESAASFQDALRAWRGGKSEPAEAAPKRAPGSFWSSVGESEVDLVRCSTPSRPPTEAAKLDSTTQGDAAPSEEKLCCYNCYKQFYKQFAVVRCSPSDVPPTPSGAGAGARRLLCSEVCADRWIVAMEQKAEAQRKRQEEMDALREAERAFTQQLQEQRVGEPQPVVAS